MRAWAFCALLAAGLAWANHAALARLDAARAAAQAARAAAQPPQPALPPDGWLRAPDAAAAARRLATIVADRGARAGSGLSVEAAGDGGGAVVRCRIVADGDEATLRRLARELEGGAPLLRLTAWRIARAGDRLRLDAEAAAPWRRG